MIMRKMTMNKPNQPLTEADMQRTPMPGEVSPEDAATKAREYAIREMAKLKKVRPIEKPQATK